MRFLVKKNIYSHSETVKVNYQPPAEVVASLPNLKKLLEKGTCLVKVPRFFASSKLCHCFGYKNEDLALKDREWTCPQYGTHRDRDVNATVNIREEGKRIFPEYFRNLLLEEVKACERAGRKKSSRGHRKKAA